MKRYINIFIIFILFLSCSVNVFADEEQTEQTENIIEAVDNNDNDVKNNDNNTNKDEIKENIINEDIEKIQTELKIEDNQEEKNGDNHATTPVSYLRKKLEENLEDTADVKALNENKKKIEKDILTENIQKELLKELNNVFADKITNNNDVVKGLLEDNKKLLDEKNKLTIENDDYKKKLEEKILKNNSLIEEIEKLTKAYKESIKKNEIDLEKLNNEEFKNNILLDKVVNLQNTIIEKQEEENNDLFYNAITINLLMLIPWLLIYFVVKLFFQNDLTKKRFFIKIHIFFSTILLITFIGSVLYVKKEEGLIIMLLMLGGLVITFRPIILSFFYSISIIGKYNIGDIIEFNGHIGLIKRITSLYTFMDLYDENKKLTENEHFFMHQDTVGKKINKIDKKNFFKSTTEIKSEIKLSNDFIVNIEEVYKDLEKIIKKYSFIDVDIICEYKKELFDINIKITYSNNDENNIKKIRKDLLLYTNKMLKNIKKTG